MLFLFDAAPRVARMIVFVVTEIPTLISYIRSELPAVPFSSLERLDKVYVSLRIAEASLNWARKAIGHYQLDFTGVEDPYVGTAGIAEMKKSAAEAIRLMRQPL